MRRQTGSVRGEREHWTERTGARFRFGGSFESDSSKRSAGRNRSEVHGIGQSQARGLIQASVKLAELTFADVCFAVVEDLSVRGLLGKPTLSDMKAVIDMGSGVATVRLGEETATVPAIALPVELHSNRPEAQAYWSWINKRLVGLRGDCRSCLRMS